MVPSRYHLGQIKYDMVIGVRLLWHFAGPFTNLVIAFVFYGVSVVTGVGLNADGSMNIIGMIFSYGIMVNLGFFVFNMIPFPPLDGSRFCTLWRQNLPDVAWRRWQYGIFVVFAIVYLANGAISAYMQGAMSAILDIFQRILYKTAIIKVSYAWCE